MSNVDQKLDLIINELKSVREEIGLVRSELKEEIASVRSELKEEIGSVRGELNEKTGSLSSELAAFKDDVNSIKTKIEILESNQLTFLRELREQRIENQTREKILLNEINKMHESIKFVNRRVADVELDVADTKVLVKHYRNAVLG